MLAWRDEWTEIDLKRCWSERVRADYRALAGQEREHWRRLFASIRGDESGRPIPGWLQRSRERIEAIGRENFRACLLRWFDPLQPGTTHKLSREGSFILRSLLWLVESDPDSRLVAAAAKIAAAEFKPKSNGQKVIRAAAECLTAHSPAGSSW